MVTTSGNPDDRNKKTEDTWIAKQITQPINFKSRKHSTREWIKQTDYFRTPKYKEFLQRPEQKYKHRMREEIAYSENPEYREKSKERANKWYKEHKEQYTATKKIYLAKKREQLKKHRAYLQKEYYNKGTTKKQANVERHLEAKKKIGFSNIELEQVL